MVDESSNNPVGEADAEWELIPWYVNGSLSEEEAAALERRKEADPDFAAEIERQLALATGVCMLNDTEIEAAEARSWAKLSAQIAAEEAARKPIAAKRSWLSSIMSNLQGRYAMAGMACLALMLAAFLMGPGPSNDPDGYRTLTSDPQQSGLFIKVQPAASLERAELERILNENGLTIVGGPSDTGVYRVAASAGTNIDNAAKDLMAAPEILFAAPE